MCEVRRRILLLLFYCYLMWSNCINICYIAGQVFKFESQFLPFICGIFVLLCWTCSGCREFVTELIGMRLANVLKFRGATALSVELKPFVLVAFF